MVTRLPSNPDARITGVDTDYTLSRPFPSYPCYRRDGRYDEDEGSRGSDSRTAGRTDGRMDGWHGNQTPVNMAKWKRTSAAYTGACSYIYLCLLVPAAENSSTGRLSTVPRRKVTLDVHLIVTEIQGAQ